MFAAQIRHQPQGHFLLHQQHDRLKGLRSRLGDRPQQMLQNWARNVVGNISHHLIGILELGIRKSCQLFRPI